jgi:hypothetical protein
MLEYWATPNPFARPLRFERQATSPLQHCRSWALFADAVVRTRVPEKRDNPNRPERVQQLRHGVMGPAPDAPDGYRDRGSHPVDRCPQIRCGALLGVLPTARSLVVLSVTFPPVEESRCRSFPYY